jgi:hypothetical protein
MNPKYPIYIVSKGRWESRLTAKALERVNIPYQIVIEPQEYNAYTAVIPPNNILTLPFGNLGQGSIPARNWIWEHALERGVKRHWILDDNIREFYRLHNNRLYRISSGVTFKVIEDFVDRYENIAQAGMQYKMFAPRRSKHPPFILNTRIYSCILNLNSLPFRWRGKYNEDTDLSLCLLKAGWCTILFNAFLAEKMATMTMKGGNTDELYRKDHKIDRRLLMAQSLQKQHPDVTKITWKWGRWQHSVNYKPFKKNKLILRRDIEIPQGINNYGMILVE